MNSTNPPILTVPLGTEAHHLAGQFAAETLQLAEATTRHQAAKRVYMNTLAVYAVDSYLKWLSYATELNRGDSWNAVLRSRWDVADLVIPGIGKLECRPVWEEETEFALPVETMEERIGYVAVQFGEQLDEAKLLGFAPAIDAAKPIDRLKVADLLSLDELIDYLYRLEVGNEFLQSNDAIALQVSEVLSTREMSEIVAQLERIYRTTSRIKWRYAGADILVGSSAAGGSDRESSESSDKIQLQKLAKNLLEKLAQMWEQ